MAPVRFGLILCVLLLTACAATAPRNTSNICTLFDDKTSWYRAAIKSEERWGIPVPVSMAFIQQESAFVARAKPPRTKIFGFIPGPRASSAVGYAQALDSTWEDYKEQSGNNLASRSNFGDAVDFVGWYNNTSNRINNIAKEDAYNLYLAYHEGNAGFTRRSYESKNWLLDVANKVQATSLVYARQIRQCEQELGNNWLQKLIP